MGFTIMENFMDEVKVYSAPGKGTTVVLVKEIRSKKELPSS
jgi:stage II sporulation protein AB (anti-sigma F factor)